MPKSSKPPADLSLPKPIVVGLAGSLIVVASACGLQSSLRLGGVGESCRATGDCEAPLSCIAEVCVDAESGSTTDGDADPDGGAVSNVAACEQFSEEFDCGGVDLAGQLDCAQLGQIACDLGEYFECLEEHTGCHDGQADTKEWVDCAKLLECTAEDTASDGNPGESEEACQRFVDSFECGDFDITDQIDCAVFADSPCDVSDYFDCLDDHTSCVDGVANTGDWLDCVGELECTGTGTTGADSGGTVTDTGTDSMLDRTGECSELGQGRYVDGNYGGTVDYLLIGASGQELCRVQFRVRTVGVPELVCEDCWWSTQIELSRPQVITDVQGVCASSERGFDAAKIAELDGQRSGFGAAEESTGHGPVIMQLDTNPLQWVEYAFGAWDPESGSLSYDRIEGFCRYSSSIEDEFRK